MSRLTWTKRSQGWHAGPYQIELAAPGLWVCSRKGRRPTDTPTIEMTSGSLRALKRRVGRMEARRRGARRTMRHTAGLAVSALIVALASFSSHEAAPFVIFVFSVSAMFFAIKAIDGVVSRSWESLRLNYQ